MKNNTDTVPYNLRLPKPLKRKYERRAKEEKRSLNQQIVHVLEWYDRLEQKPEPVTMTA